MHRRSWSTTLLPCVVLGLAIAAPARSDAQAGVPPDPGYPVAVADSELRDAIARYSTDRAALQRRYAVAQSPERMTRMKTFLEDWRARAASLPVASLGVEGRADAVLLRNRIDYELRLLARETDWWTRIAPLLPFARGITDLNDARVRMETIDPPKAAATLDALAAQIDTARRAIEGPPAKTGGAPDKLAAFRAQDAIEPLKAALKSWYDFYAGYHPAFSWWTEHPYGKVTKALDAYRKGLRERVLDMKAGDEEPIVGTPIGREALVADLLSEFVPYTPEELLAVGEREFAWCEIEMKKAAREMGFGDDWKAALEKVKTLYVEPGRQPDLIRDLAREAEEYLETNGLITVPPLAREVWRMQMMTPERQKVNPFFTGAEVISVSYPTNTMEHDDKMMSLRGNNPHFSRATVFHELIPGHHLQSFMTARYNSHRQAFATPFWTEGWALYWEMVLWDRGFTAKPEDRVGALFWRMHRAARIVFSLQFHLGRWTPPQCIDFLVDRVGHERANAEAEVRRSFNGTYPPLYQLAYMMGGLQFRALRAELVDKGVMTERQYHDAVLSGGNMPVELIRARLTGQSLTLDHKPAWRFAGELPAAK